MPRGVARDHAAKRAQIRKKAATYFASTGFAGASMAQVAAACGVSKALIYHYYDRKEDLLFDILDTHLSGLVDAAQTVCEGPDHLRNLIRTILLAYRDSDAEHKVQLEALPHLPVDRQAPLLEMQRHLVAQMEAALASAGGPIREDLTRPLAMSVFGMLNWYYMWHRPGRGMAREAYAELVTDLVLGGIDAL